MACKNNKRNWRRTVFYYINQFNYEAREKLTKGIAVLEETHTDEKAKMVELRLDYK